MFQMEPNRDLATWLLGHRREIERLLADQLGPAAPRASGPEAETLRRFRTYASAALARGEAPAPALDGLRPNERRVMALLSAWTDSAAALAGERGQEVRHALTPLLHDFRLSLRSDSVSRPGKEPAKPRAARRAVAGAIDRVVDAFVAVDVNDGLIVDANPAAGALLGVDRDALIGIELTSFVPEPEQAEWWSQLDAIAEGNPARRFPAVLSDVEGRPMQLEATLSRLASRGRTLALALMRPHQSNGGGAVRPTPGPNRSGGARAQ
jgi:PAS domain S-box-containing protein